MVKSFKYQLRKLHGGRVGGAVMGMRKIRVLEDVNSTYTQELMRKDICTGN